MMLSTIVAVVSSFKTIVYFPLKMLRVGRHENILLAMKLLGRCSRSNQWKQLGFFIYALFDMHRKLLFLLLFFLYKCTKTGMLSLSR